MRSISSGVKCSDFDMRIFLGSFGVMFLLKYYCGRETGLVETEVISFKRWNVELRDPNESLKWNAIGRSSREYKGLYYVWV